MYFPDLMLIERTNVCQVVVHREFPLESTHKWNSLHTISISTFRGVGHVIHFNGLICKNTLITFLMNPKGLHKDILNITMQLWFLEV